MCKCMCEAVQYVSQHVCFCMQSLTLYVVTDIEELNVVLKEDSRTTTLWWLSGNHGDLWHHGEVTVGRIPRDFTILFEASRTFTKPGHIAIDDIDFTNCTLPGRLPALPAHSTIIFFSWPLFFKADLRSWNILWFPSQSRSPGVQRICSCATTVCVWSATKCVTSAMTVGTGLMRTAVVRYHKC